MLTNEKHEGIIEYYGANGVHAPGAYRYFTIRVPTGQFYANGDPILQDLNVANAVTMYSAATDYSTLSEIDCYPNGTLALYANNATLSNVTVWSADSILTQGRADSRYMPVGSNLTGTLASLSDVQLADIAIGDQLTYDATSKWKNKPPQGVSVVDGGNF